jgi:hypothetical protein
MISSTFGMSKPLEATSVATRTLILPSLNPWRVSSRECYGISPCITLISFFENISDIIKEFASALVFVKTIDLPPIPYITTKEIRFKN